MAGAPPQTVVFRRVLQVQFLRPRECRCGDAFVPSERAPDHLCATCEARSLSVRSGRQGGCS